MGTGLRVPPALGVWTQQALRLDPVFRWTHTSSTTPGQPRLATSQDAAIQVKSTRVFINALRLRQLCGSCSPSSEALCPTLVAPTLPVSTPPLGQPALPDVSHPLFTLRHWPCSAPHGVTTEGARGVGRVQPPQLATPCLSAFQPGDQSRQLWGSLAVFCGRSRRIGEDLHVELGSPRAWSCCLPRAFLQCQNWWEVKRARVGQEEGPGPSLGEHPLSMTNASHSKHCPTQEGRALVTQSSLRGPPLDTTAVARESWK